MPNAAASAKPTKNGMKSTALVMICFNRMAIPTHGRSEPTVKMVFIGIPSIGSTSLIRFTISAPTMQMMNVGRKEQMI